MDSTPQPSAAEAWLHKFQQHKASTYRAVLCTQYGLTPLDAAALINEACFEVYRYWAKIEYPGAIFALTLRRLVQRSLHRRHTEQAVLHTYAAAMQRDVQGQVQLMAHVAAVLAHVSPCERQLLEWFVHGVDDRKVAAALGISPTRVRGRRHESCQKLRQQYSAEAPPHVRCSTVGQAAAPERLRGAEAPAGNNVKILSKQRSNA
jgi:DNA-directed RNA polymerase specialized sigma24 family protein